MAIPVSNYHSLDAGRAGGDIRAAFVDAALSLPEARPNVVTVALMQTLDWHPWLDQASALLSVSEADRVQRRHIAVQRDMLALAYALHRLALGHVLQLDPVDVPLVRDARGCPRLAGGIAQTSLSHADNLVAIAVSLSGAVGVDIEAAARAGVMPEIAGRVCHRREAAQLARLTEPARGAALLALWVRKEAVLKAAGVGMEVAMESFAAPEHPALVLPGLCFDAVQVRMLDAGVDCVAAVAAPRGALIDCRWLRPLDHAHGNAFGGA